MTELKCEAETIIKVSFDDETKADLAALNTRLDNLIDLLERNLAGGGTPAHELNGLAASGAGD